VNPERVVLIGFMASGKTQVGMELAHRLGWRHIDLDSEIENLTGHSVADLFATRGESAFRALEVQITPNVMRQSEAVISTGGGWVTNPGLLERLPPATLTVYLRVSPDEALRRIAAEPDQPVRPMLFGPDPAGRITELLSARDPLYRRAELVIDTDARSASDIADQLHRIVHSGLHGRPPSEQNAQHGIE
jgi:shikimate kinase